MKNTFFILLTLVVTSAHASNCIAHRGNNQFYLENSHRAVMSAVEVNSDGVEFDVRHTKDGFPILMHDKKMRRMATNKEGRNCELKEKVNKLTLAHIQENCKLKNGEDIPLLEEILKELEPHNLYIFIDSKINQTKKHLISLNVTWPHIQVEFESSASNTNLSNSLENSQTLLVFGVKLKPCGLRKSLVGPGVLMELT